MVYRLYYAKFFHTCFATRTLRDQNNRVVGYLRNDVEVEDVNAYFVLRKDIIPNPNHPDAVTLERCPFDEVVLAGDAKTIGV